MQVIRANAMGMCFGVNDALRIAENIAEPAQITIHGELVHNPVVNAALRTRGFQGHWECHRARIPATPVRVDFGAWHQQYRAYRVTAGR